MEHNWKQGNQFNLSDIMDWTGATTVSKWQANHTFGSFVDGGINGEIKVNPGEPVLLYLAADLNFEDMILNITSHNTSEANVTNQSASTWNLVVNLNTTVNLTFADIDRYLNCNNTVPLSFVGGGCAHQANNVSQIDYFSFYNNSASAGSKYVPYVANWSINNNTGLEYGQCVWLNMGGAGANELTIGIDWNNISIN